MLEIDIKEFERLNKPKEEEVNCSPQIEPEQAGLMYEYWATIE